MARSRTARVFLTAASVAAALRSSHPVLAQCAMCRSTLINSPEGQKLLASFNAGVLLLLATPFLIVVIIAALIVRPHVTAWLTRTARTRRLHDSMRLRVE